jgi:hypothetical protein
MVKTEVEQWISEFIAEVDRIEAFFQSNLKDLKAEFRKLEKQYNHNHMLDTEGNSIKPKYMEQRNESNDSIQADIIDLNVFY